MIKEAQSVNKNQRHSIDTLKKISFIYGVPFKELLNINACKDEYVDLYLQRAIIIGLKQRALSDIPSEDEVVVLGAK